MQNVSNKKCTTERVKVDRNFLGRRMKKIIRNLIKEYLIRSTYILHRGRKRINWHVYDFTKIFLTGKSFIKIFQQYYPVKCQSVKSVKRNERSRKTGTIFVS